MNVATLTIWSTVDVRAVERVDFSSFRSIWMYLFRSVTSILWSTWELCRMVTVFMGWPRFSMHFYDYDYRQHGSRFTMKHNFPNLMGYFRLRFRWPIVEQNTASLRAAYIARAQTGWRTQPRLDTPGNTRNRDPRRERNVSIFLT